MRLKRRCLLHTKYRGNGKPHVHCPGCWYLFVKKNSRKIREVFLKPSETSI